MRRLVISLIAAFLLSAAYAGAAAAGPFIVNTTADGVDVFPGDNVCKNFAGDCTLRAAVQEANAWPGWDDIEVPVGVYQLTLVGAGEDAGATGDLDVRSEMGIFGQNPRKTIVDGINADRVFDLQGASAAMSGLMVRGGREMDGAGIRTIRSKLDLRWADLWVNNATRAGGGIWAYSSYTGLYGVTFVDNTAGQYGGAVFLRGPVWASADFENVTVHANSARTFGGGIFTVQPVTLRNVTIANNRASDGGGIFYNGPQPVAYNTIVAYNWANDCSGWLNSAANNLDTDKTCGFFSPTDLPGVDPFLDGLIFSGAGPFPTPNWVRPLLPWSPAIDAGDNATCSSVDERGELRPTPAGGRCDIGAYEAP
jgi:CSLREA domain-containing protein